MLGEDRSQQFTQLPDPDSLPDWLPILHQRIAAPHWLRIAASIPASGSGWPLRPKTVPCSGLAISGDKLGADPGDQRQRHGRGQPLFAGKRRVYSQYYADWWQWVICGIAAPHWLRIAASIPASGSGWPLRPKPTPGCWSR
jgi:hypothetical protein